jgi:hypothetical protein
VRCCRCCRCCRCVFAPPPKPSEGIANSGRIRRCPPGPHHPGCQQRACGTQNHTSKFARMTISLDAFQSWRPVTVVHE